MKRSNLRRFIISMIFGFMLLTVSPFKCLAAEEYTFERMLPVLEQPWYFWWPISVAVDSSGNFYVTTEGDNLVHKFSPSWGFITSWGGYGVGNGKFNRPYGIAIDGSDNVYVADWGNSRIQKFSSSGVFIHAWGNQGNGDGELSHPHGLATDSEGHVYVADTWNHRIQKFNSSGIFVSKWGAYGSGDGKFDNPLGISVDGSGNLYVVDSGNHRIQKFTSSGSFLCKWGAEGTGDGAFHYPFGIAVDGSNKVYVTDENQRIQKFSDSGTFIKRWGTWGNEPGYFSNPKGLIVDRDMNVYVADCNNNRIQKFDSSGLFIAKYGSEGSEDGNFHDPKGIAVDATGNIYVADQLNHRIQKFTASGVFITKWGSKGSGDGEFRYPQGITIDSAGHVYVADADNHRIQKFTASGDFISKWGKQGSEDGQFSNPEGIAIDAEGHVYVADFGNHRIQKFTASGDFISKWGKQGSEDGELDSPAGIAVDAVGYLYVVDYINHCIQKFTTSGNFLNKWGSEGSGEGEFYHPIGVSVDDTGNVYVADTWNNRIQKFTGDGVFVTKLDSFGSSPGLLNNPAHLSVNSEGKILVTELSNDRVQVFAPSTITTVSKAIIVAGSGPYKTNTLWDATQMCANYAYRALTYQGYTRDTIYYLSADTELDLDGDGSPDVDADATNSNLEYALKTWAGDADSLFIYMVGHGGEGTFQMGQYELLDASELDTWMDTTQQTIPDFLVMVYDACHSGSFLPYLIPPAGKTRILASSAGPNEPAVFQADGGLSFGFQFFAYLFNGGSFYDSYLHGQKSVEGAYDYKQTPHIEGNGNGVGNEKADKEMAETIKLGNETKTAGDIPQIESVSAPQTLAEGETSAFIHAQNVVDTNGIQEVFAVIKPPDYESGPPDKPVTDLPTINLAAIGNNSYSGMYNGFTVEGVYNVAVFARDGKGILSLPYQTSVTVKSSTDCLAVASDLSIQLPCADYNGAVYGFTLDFYRNPDDMSGYYWKMIKSTLTTGTGSACISIASDLSMPMDCVSYNGTQYGFTLRFYNNPYDPSGLYWKMDGSTLVVK